MTEKETEVGTMFHFCFISVCTLFSNKRCQRQTGGFTMFHFVQSLLRDAVRCSVCAQRRTI